ncbi:MAG: hypothetical protein Q8P18_09580 [Pseudomonadota bacterium]|nr:hypothetical protein [Pseudomonadota bacterium]
MSLDPYGYPTDQAPAARMGLFARFGVTLAWLSFDLFVGVCSAGFTAFAWDNPEDPQFIAFFSSPFWGMAAAGTLMSMLTATFKVHPILQVLLSGLAAAAGCLALPLLTFMGIVIAA